MYFLGLGSERANKVQLTKLLNKTGELFVPAEREHGALYGCDYRGQGQPLERKNK